MKIQDVLKIKSQRVITVRPDETVYAAIQKLVDNNIGALPVCETDNTLVGIISERDILRACLKQHDFKKTLVREIMTGNVAVGGPDDDLDYAISAMTQKRIRHLPIVSGDKLQSIVSMRDMVDEELKKAQAEIRYVSLIKRSHLNKPLYP